MLACPRTRHVSLAETNWLLKNDRTSEESRVFFLRDYKNREEECLFDMVPSIKKIEIKDDDNEGKYCSRSEAEMYEIGYPVASDDEAKDVQFLSVYKICHSRAKGNGATLYSIHRIEAPSVQHEDGVAEVYKLNPLDHYYKSYLDENLKTRESFEIEDHYAYRFVGNGDIPTGSWEPTIRFLFNYTPITQNVDLFKGMIRADIYIRLYSKKNNKKLTLYSGTFQEQKENNSGFFGRWRNSIIESFWRIIVDDDGNGIFLGTQHTLTECGEAYLCDEIDRKVKKYKEGGCIYTCSLYSTSNLLLFDLLDLPKLKIKGNLDFTFQTNETETVPPDGQESSGTKTSKKADIIDFLDNESYESALKSIGVKITF